MGGAGGLSKNEIRTVLVHIDTYVRYTAAISYIYLFIFLFINY
jgi:hypothetical protein